MGLNQLAARRVFSAASAAPHADLVIPHCDKVLLELHKAGHYLAPKQTG